MAGIVVGFDGSDSSVAALRWAVEEATLRDVEVRAVYVWQSPYMHLMPDSWSEKLGPYIDLREAAEHRMHDLLAGVALPSGAAIRPVLREGSPARVLLEEASEADLLVLGARGHGGFAGLVLGSVADAVVRHAAVPTVVVRTVAAREPANARPAAVETVAPEGRVQPAWSSEVTAPAP